MARAGPLVAGAIASCVCACASVLGIDGTYDVAGDGSDGGDDSTIAVDASAGADSVSESRDALCPDHGCTNGQACAGSNDCASGGCTNGVCVGDPSWNDVVLLMHFDGADGGTSFVDQRGHPVTGQGTATISTTTSISGGASLLVNGGFLQTANTAEWNLTSGDSTVEAWVYPIASGQAASALLSQSSATVDGQWLISRLASGSIDTQDNGGGNDFSGGYVATGAWHHVAVVRASGSTSIFVDGAPAGSTTFDFYTASTQPLFIGGANTSSNGYSYCWVGYVDELRITKGVARYTTSFTPSKSPFPNGP
jgi:hypothetical protein